jgi:hypothetical protein
MQNRRDFLKKTLLSMSALVAGEKFAFAKTHVMKQPCEEAKATVVRSVNGQSAGNMEKVIEMAGGIDELIGLEDVVIIKPNIQWWNQGAPNLSAVKTFIEMIMERPGGFYGEVIIAENTHMGASPWERTGWAKTFQRNSGDENIRNFNELGSLLKRRYSDKFSICHLINVDASGKRVYSPDDGPGYVFCDGTGGVPLIEMNNSIQGKDARSVIMTYPIIKSDKGTIIDFKSGIWEKGDYTQQPLKFINFSALNHHSPYCGATSSIKNYLGISDLSGGPDPQNNGKLTEKYYNFHSFPFNKWKPGPAPGMIGAEIGRFMKTIRKADLNINHCRMGRLGIASPTACCQYQSSVSFERSRGIGLSRHEVFALSKF